MMSLIFGIIISMFMTIRIRKFIEFMQIIVSLVYYVPILQKKVVNLFILMFMISIRILLQSLLGRMLLVLRKKI